MANQVKLMQQRLTPFPMFGPDNMREQSNLKKERNDEVAT